MHLFNTAGPVRPDTHDVQPPLQRWDLAEVLALVEDEKEPLSHFRSRFGLSPRGS